MPKKLFSRPLKRVVVLGNRNPVLPSCFFNMLCLKSERRQRNSNKQVRFLSEMLAEKHFNCACHNSRTVSSPQLLSMYCPKLLAIQKIGDCNFIKGLQMPVGCSYEHKDSWPQYSSRKQRSILINQPLKRGRVLILRPTVVSFLHAAASFKQQEGRKWLQNSPGSKGQQSRLALGGRYNLSS